MAKFLTSSSDMIIGKGHQTEFYKLSAERMSTAHVKNHNNSRRRKWKSVKCGMWWKWNKQKYVWTNYEVYFHIYKIIIKWKTAPTQLRNRSVKYLTWFSTKARDTDRLKLLLNCWFNKISSFYQNKTLFKVYSTTIAQFLPFFIAATGIRRVGREWLFIVWIRYWVSRFIRGAFVFIIVSSFMVIQAFATVKRLPKTFNKSRKTRILYKGYTLLHNWHSKMTSSSFLNRRWRCSESERANLLY